MLAAGVLARDARDSYYVYRLTMGAHRQLGLVAAASVAAYDAGRIKKHEFTRPVKEDDRVRQIDALNAQTGPVFLVYRATATVDDILAEVASHGPDVDVVVTRDGVRHELWQVDDADRVLALSAAFDDMRAIYVADGHHRSAAASRVARARRETVGEGGHDNFLSVLFPHDQVRILDYNRVVRDLRDRDSDDFLGEVATRFDLQMADGPWRPRRPGEFGMYLDGRWYRLQIHEERVPADDPVGRLDVSLLQENLIGPLLGVTDPRRDDRIDFVGGIRGTAALEQRVDSGDWAVAFTLCPTAVQALMDVADAGEVMPPKSTWFEPKLADGLVSHVLD
jgi:uncharacterized protein (DUF1015 family)